MSSTYGENIRLTLFGSSHGPGVGMVLDGIPAGETLDRDALRAFLRRRSPGRSEVSSPRREEDEPVFLSGLGEKGTTGGPLTVFIRNEDVKTGDYDAFSRTPRPGHADFTARMKEGQAAETAGGGRYSGRLTAALCAAGGVCLQLLAKEGIRVISRIARIGGIEDTGELTEAVSGKAFPVMDDARGEEMRRAVLAAKEAGDSLGGVVECAVLGLPAGLGDHPFGGMENRISAAVFSIPAVKGVEFGSGFAGAALPGSRNNDAFVILPDGRVGTRTNRCGGVLGGITTGMPLLFRVAVKPTPTVAISQDTVDLTTMTPAAVRGTGRHDPCIVPRAVPCVEAAAALAVYDAVLQRRKERPWP